MSSWRRVLISGGTYPEKLRERIQQTDAETLLDWSKRILTAKTPEDVVHEGSSLSEPVSTDPGSGRAGFNRPRVA